VTEAPSGIRTPFSSVIRDVANSFSSGLNPRGTPGISEFSLADKKCTSLLSGVTTFGVIFAADSKSFLYAVPSQHEVSIFRQAWQDGKLIGQPQVAVKLPFAFPLLSGGNAYDFAPDLSTVVYARPAGHADLYLLSQK